jgi:hypothetical protein
MGDRAADIMGAEAAIEAHAFGELLNATVGRLIKNTAPRLVWQREFPRGFWSSVGNRRIGKRAGNAGNPFTVSRLRQSVNEQWADAA